jgi:hypothetical protein
MASRVLHVAPAALSVGGLSQHQFWEESRDKRQTAELPRSGHLLCFRSGLEPATLAMRRTLWRKENFACVRIFYCGSRRKTKDLDVARVRSERTGNETWFTRDRSSIR